MFRLCVIMLLLPWSAGMMAQRKLVVASLESRIPQRDVKVRIDNGSEIRTPWNGQIEVPDSFRRIDLCHPKFQRRYVLRGELRSDTIFLIPAINALDEVVILGKDRQKEMMANIMRTPTPSTPQLPQVIATGPNVLAMMAWIFEHTLGPKLEARYRRKQALKKVRAQELEYERRWDALRDTTAYRGQEITKP